MRKEPTNSTRLHAHPQVVEIFTRENWMNFFDNFRGFDDEIANEFALSLVPHTRNHAILTIRGISIEITPEFISRVTTLPLGLPWSKDEKIIGQTAKRKFFQDNENPVEDKNGIRRDSVSYPWDEVIYQVIIYISCEGRHNIVYGYYFIILQELRYGMDTPAHQKLSIPYFRLQCLIDSNTKVQDGNSHQLARHGLIKILVEEALHTLTIPIAWEIFRNMTAEDDIKALTYDVSPTISEKGEQQGG